MKKYNVFELYVVKEDNYYFICEKGIKEDTYIEIFTHKIIKNPNVHYIKPLSRWYLPLALMNYSIEKPLILTKKELLIKYAEINSPYIERRKKLSSNYETFIKEQEEHIKALKELAEKNPEKAKEEAIASLRETGILDENGDLAAPYNTLLGDESEKYIPTEHGRALIKKNDRN